MTQTRLKIAGITAIAMLAGAGTAFAGGGKDCDHKKKAAMKTEAAASGQTAVMGASEKMTKAKKARVVLSFDEAMELCQKKAADNLQACIDYKTGATDSYKKPSS